MTSEEAFWDASALVPLCIPQAPTPALKAIYRRFSVVWWWGTPVEIASGLARLLRMQKITPEEWREARAYAEQLARSSSSVFPSDSLLASAIDLVTRYDLRAGDALQLAAALAWCENKPSGCTFLTLDQRLRDAALLCGFDAKAV